MRRIAIINQKGGVGKTTTTANLGAALAQAGKRTFLVDLDPQGHLTLHFGLTVGPEQATVYDVLTASTPVAEAKMAAREHIDVLPADIDLAAAEAELVSVTGREVLLREALGAFGTDYDAMLIDCAPSLGVLTINALAACTEVVIPLQAHFFALQGLSKLLETVTLVRQRINPQLRVSGIALCMHEGSTRLAAEIAEDLTRFLQAARGSGKPWADAQLYQTAVRRNIKLAESSSFGQTVFDYAPRSNGAVDYANLAAEIFPGLPVEVGSGEESPASEPVVVKAAERKAKQLTVEAQRGRGDGREAERWAPSAGSVRSVVEKPARPTDAEEGRPLRTNGKNMPQAVEKPVRRPAAEKPVLPAVEKTGRVAAEEKTISIVDASKRASGLEPKSNGRAASTPAKEESASIAQDAMKRASRTMVRARLAKTAATDSPAPAGTAGAPEAPQVAALMPVSAKGKNAQPQSTAAIAEKNGANGRIAVPTMTRGMARGSLLQGKPEPVRTRVPRGAGNVSKVVADSRRRSSGASEKSASTEVEPNRTAPSGEVPGHHSPEGSSGAPEHCSPGSDTQVAGV